MTALLGRAALAALCIAFAGDAAARELRYPAGDNPAFILQLPDDWTDELDPDQNQIVVSADRSTSIVLSRGTYSGSLEDAAKGMLHFANATPPTGQAPTSISGLAGFFFDSTMKVGSGPPLQLKLAIVRAGEKGYMSCTKIERQGNSPEQRQLADTVMQSVKIVGTENRQ